MAISGNTPQSVNNDYISPVVRGVEQSDVRVENGVDGQTISRATSSISIQS